MLGCTIDVCILSHLQYVTELRMRFVLPGAQVAATQTLPAADVYLRKATQL